jgi:hypothetical protein
MTQKFELTFFGDAMVKFPRYRRIHSSFESAHDRARAVLALLENRGAHPAIIYGPGCGRDGVTVS